MIVKKMGLMLKKPHNDLSTDPGLNGSFEKVVSPYSR
jgi:hypothetical protein